LVCLNTPRLRSSASLSRVTRCDQRLVVALRGLLRAAVLVFRADFFRRSAITDSLTFILKAERRVQFLPPQRELCRDRGVNVAVAGSRHVTRLKTSGAQRPGVFLHWLIPMALQQNPAFEDRAVLPAATAPTVAGIIETSIPSRLDALIWSGFHTRVVLALG